MNKYAQILALWKSFAIKTPEDIDLYLHSFRILFAFNSGKIENSEITYHDTRELFENGRILNFSGNPRALFEQENQKLCYEYLKGMIVQRVPISVSLVQEIHRILTSGTYDERRYISQGERPGAFKKHDYVTGVHEVGSSPQDVEKDISDLLDELHEYRFKDTLKVGAYFHVRFEYIHPFADGNGRVGRTLLNYFLMIHGHPPIIIYDEDKATYYKALEAYDSTEDVQPMYDFLIIQTEKTWQKTLEKAQYES